jgi:hypothetical protein
MGKSKTKTGCKFMPVSFSEATTNGKTDRCQDKDRTVKAVQLHWELRVLQSNKSPTRCTRRHFSFSLKALVLDEKKDVVEMTDLLAGFDPAPQGNAELC